MTLRIDYSNMMISPGGVDPKAWSAAGKQFADAKIGCDALRATGSVGFPDLPIDRPLLDQVTKFSAAARGKYDDVVILGIGGSALGPIALRTALRPHGWNMLDEKARGGYPRLQVLDNVDPETIAALLSGLQLARTLFVVTSKSGGTAETMAQFLIVPDRLSSAKLHRRIPAALRSAATFCALVRSALGGEPREKANGRNSGWIDAACGAGGN